MGIIACGGVAVGVVSLGGVSVGLLGIGGLAIGGVVAGGGALALVANGGGAVGVVAQGGLAIGYFARGGATFGVHALGPVARDAGAIRFFEDWSWIFGNQATMVWMYYIWLLAGMIAVTGAVCVVIALAYIMLRSEPEVR